MINKEKIIQLQPNKRIYLASDQHLGLPNYEESLVREKKVIQWLDVIKEDVQVLFLLGDLFDFWFEYKKVVPKNHIRILAKLAELSDAGIRIIFFQGNHDMWVNDYFEHELGFEIYAEPQEFTIDGKNFLIGHGDGLGPGDTNYKILRKVFRNKFFQECFKWIHPDIGVSLGEYFSRKNKLLSGDKDKEYLGNDKEYLVQYCKEQAKIKNYDYFIFGHRHLDLKIEVAPDIFYLNSGDWLSINSYVQISKCGVTLQYFRPEIQSN